MVYDIARVRREVATGYLQVRVRFWRRKADRDAAQPPDHVNDFRLDCPAWPAQETVKVPYDLTTGLEVPRDQVMKGQLYDWRDETRTPDVRAHVHAVIRRYIARRKADRQISRDGRDLTTPVTNQDAYLQRSDLQQLVTDTVDDGDDW